MTRTCFAGMPRCQAASPIRKIRATLVLGAVLTAGLVVAFSARVAQDPGYHHFADAREFLGVSNACDVVSNVAFAFVGLVGLGVLVTNRAVFAEARERRPWLVLFAAVVATSFGSAWYHLAPDNETLVWDRLPMAVAFTSMVAALVMDRVSVNVGARLFGPLVTAGVATVVYWSATEARGVGDLRPYLFVQFGAMAAVPLLVALYPGRYTRSVHWVLALALYATSKLLEVADARVFTATGFVSGHTLKHLAAAAAVAALAAMLTTRRSWPSVAPL